MSLQHPRPVPPGAQLPGEAREHSAERDAQASDARAPEGVQPDQVVATSFMERRRQSMVDGQAPGSDVQIRRAVNALSLTGSFVAALTEAGYDPMRFDPEAPSEPQRQAVEDVRTMLAASRRAAAALMSELGVVDQPWAQYQVMRTVCEAVAHRWRETGRTPNGPSADVMDLVPVWAELARAEMPAGVEPEASGDDSIAHSIALVDAMRPVVHEVRQAASLHRDAARLERGARDRMVESARIAAMRLSPAGAPESSRRHLFRSLLVQAGQLYAHALRQRVRESLDQMMMLGAGGLAQGGSSPGPESVVRLVEFVDRSFDEGFARLVDMVGQLARPNAGLDPSAERRAR